MCGLTGFWEPAGVKPEYAQRVGQAMVSRLLHRGPDDSGIWLDDSAGIVLCHQRLSILDLTEAGHQPMGSPSSRFIIAFNGEIYNHLELRKELNKIDQNISWRGHSDTETLLVGFETWGIEATLKRSTGMFAFALWDRSKRSLYLARDRMGEKPLYYGWQGSVFLFGSELKAIRQHPSFCASVDRDSLALLLRHNYIPTPRSIYKGFFKLLPGNILCLDERKNEPTIRPYWSIKQQAQSGIDSPYTGGVNEAQNELERLLRKSIQSQMIADVPLGAFLSGGVDSSVIVALMQQQSNQPVKTFSIGFLESEYNEAHHAEAVARHIGTDHTDLYVTPTEAMDIIPQLPTLFDEPFSDSSQIPTFLVSKLARQHVTVSLSGDGGDELFGGYNRYLWTMQIWKKLTKFPYPVRLIIARMLTSLSPNHWNVVFKYIERILPSSLRYSDIGSKLHKISDFVSTKSQDDIYLDLVSHWKEPSGVILNSIEPPTIVSDGNECPSFNTFEQKMMYLDLMTYLPDDILVKVDRAAMGVSLETRVPFLDHHLVEYSLGLPISMKIQNGAGKVLLRNILHKYVPQELVDRPKMGFGVPIDSWLRGPLRDWAWNLLSSSRLKEEGFFKPEAVLKKWNEHLSGQRNWQYYLWDVLMFQAWLENEKNL